jgi:hypothetical protein
MSKVSAEMKLKIKTSANARPRVIWLSVAFSVLICCAPAFGQAATAPSEPAKKSDAIRPQVAQGKPTSPIAMINLVNLLVKQGILKEEQAKELIKQAEDEAHVAREAAKDAGAKADDAAKAATAAAKATEPPGTRHVTYVPEVVKRQLREEIKQEVMAKAEQENWASPGKYPEWAQRIHVSGDVRMRYEAMDRSRISMPSIPARHFLNHPPGSSILTSRRLMTPPRTGSSSCCAPGLASTSIC